PSFLLSSRSVPHRSLHSFPTRRSSDLDRAVEALVADPQQRPRRAARLHPRARRGGARGPVRSLLPAPGSPLRNGPFLQLLVYRLDRKSTRLNSSHVKISYAVFCLKKKN